MDIHSFVGIFWHETIALFTGQTIVDGKLGDWVADIVIKPRNHSHLTFWIRWARFFHVDIAKRLHDLFFCFMEWIMKLEVTKELIIGFAGIPNLKYSF